MLGERDLVIVVMIQMLTCAGAWGWIILGRIHVTGKYVAAEQCISPLYAFFLFGLYAEAGGEEAKAG